MQDNTASEQVNTLDTDQLAQQAQAEKFNQENARALLTQLVEPIAGAVLQLLMNDGDFIGRLSILVEDNMNKRKELEKHIQNDAMWCIVTDEPTVGPYTWVINIQPDVRELTEANFDKSVLITDVRGKRMSFVSQSKNLLDKIRKAVLEHGPEVGTNVYITMRYPDDNFDERQAQFIHARAKAREAQEFDTIQSLESELAAATEKAIAEAAEDRKNATEPAPVVAPDAPVVNDEVQPTTESPVVPEVAPSEENEKAPT